jgi:protein translocase SecG subunit
MNNQSILLWAQAITLIITVILILIQNRGASLDSAFGGKNEIYLTRRGIEKGVVNFTSIAIIAFIVVRILSLYFV